MRNIKHIYKIYFIIIFSLSIYLSGTIILNSNTQRKDLVEDLRLGLQNLSRTIGHFALDLNSSQHFVRDKELGYFQEISDPDKFITTIFNSKGDVINLSSGQPANIFNVEGADGNKYIQKICNNIKDDEQEGFMTFQKLNPSGRTDKWLLYYCYVPDIDWIIVSSSNLSSHLLSLNSQIETNVILSVIFVILVMFISVCASKNFNKQLSELTNAVNRYSSKDFGARALIKSNDEVGKLAIQFNQMADKLDSLYKNLHDKVEERTHALKIGNEELQRRNEEIEQQNEEIRAINDEIQLLNNELSESEKKTRRLIESLEDEYFFYSQDLDEKYTYVSPSVSKLLGYDQSEVRFGVKPYLSENPLNKFAREASIKSMKGEKQPPFEIEIKDKNNNLRKFELLEVPIFNKNKQVVMVEGVAHEITERKRTEQIQKIYGNIANAVLQNKSIEELIVVIKEQLSSIIDTKNFFIALYDEETDMFSLPFMADENDHFQSFPAEKTMSAHVVKTRESLMLNFSEQEEMAAKGEIKLVGTRSKIWLGVPLKTEDTVIGVIAVQSYSDANAYNEKDKRVIEIISSQITQAILRKFDEQKLIKEKAYAERILTVVPSAVFTVDKNRIIKTWNKKAEILTGWTAGEAIGKSCDYFSFTTCDNHCRLFDDESVKPISNQECVIKTKSGSNITILKNTDNLYDANGQVIGGIESFENITERKRAEIIQEITKNIANAVLLSEDLGDLIQMIKNELQKLLDTKNFYIALYDEETKYLSFPFFINEKDQTKPQPLSNNLTSYVIKTGKSLLADIPKKKKLVEEGKLEYQGALSKIWLGVPLQIKDKVIGVISVQSYENENAYNETDVKILEIISTQISLSVARKKVADQLKATNLELNIQKEELQTTLETLQNTQSQLVQSEKMAALGQLIAGIAHEINTPLGAINASIGNMSDSIQLMINSLPQLLSIMTEDDLNLYLKLISLADFVSPEQSSKEKRQLKRMITKQLEEKGIDEPDKIAEMVLYIKVHEHLDEISPMLKNDHSSFILSNARNIISIKKNTQNINLAVTKASKIVFALKKFAHRDHIGEKVETDLIDGIETVLTLYHNQIKQGVEIIRDFKSIPIIRCYQDEINQVWTNLIHNALQAMDNKGNLKISVGKEGQGVSVKISDTGSGIPEELRENIFQAFFTTKKAGEGSGLGLDIVKKIIDKHGGTIDFVSEVGVGTTFMVWLPLATD